MRILSKCRFFLFCFRYGIELFVAAAVRDPDKSVLQGRKVRLPMKPCAVM